jgi:hypothetical protein
MKTDKELVKTALQGDPGQTMTELSENAGPSLEETKDAVSALARRGDVRQSGRAFFLAVSFFTALLSTGCCDWAQTKLERAESVADRLAGLCSTWPEACDELAAARAAIATARAVVAAVCPPPHDPEVAAMAATRATRQGIRKELRRLERVAERLESTN